MSSETQAVATSATATEKLYADPERVGRLASTAEVLSILFFVLGVVIFVFGAWSAVQSLTSSVPRALLSTMSSLAPGLIVIGLGTLLCLFFWVFLRAVSEGLFMVMDIWETSHAAKTS
jgi:hypothetical protein